MKKISYAALGFAAAGLAIGVVVTQHAAWWQLICTISSDVRQFEAARPLYA